MNINKALAIKDEKSFELKKHVGAIHTSNKLSLLQRKIANALLYNAYEKLLELNEHQIHINTLCGLIGYDSKDYKLIKKSLVSLLTTAIEWNLVDGNKLDSEGVWNASSIIADASIDGAICTYSYSNKMRQLLYSPELYGRINLAVQSQFQSSYGLALYENCIRYQNIRQTPWLDLVKFRKLMGVEDNQYLRFTDFKKRVLDKAIEEVNLYAPIQIQVKLQKKSKQIIALQFLISRRTDKVEMEGEGGADSVVDSLAKKLKNEYGLSKSQINDCLTKHSEEYIREKIKIIESSASFINGKIKSLARYLLNALQEDYQPSTKLVIRDSIKNDREKRHEDQIRNEYRTYQEKEIIVIYNKLSKEMQDKILKEFEKSISNTMYLDIYEKNSINHHLISYKLGEFIKRFYPLLANELKSLEEFIREHQAV